jgi:hypothetical protein
LVAFLMRFALVAFLMHPRSALILEPDSPLSLQDWCQWLMRWMSRIHWISLFHQRVSTPIDSNVLDFTVGNYMNVVYSRRWGFLLHAMVGSLFWVRIWKLFVARLNDTYFIRRVQHQSGAASELEVSCCVSTYKGHLCYMTAWPYLVSLAVESNTFNLPVMSSDTSDPWALQELA